MVDKSERLPHKRTLFELARDSTTCMFVDAFKCGIPVGIGAGLATYFAVRKGYLNSGDMIQKVVAGSFVGYVVGSIGYTWECVGKLRPPTIQPKVDTVGVDQQTSTMEKVDDTTDGTSKINQRTLHDRFRREKRTAQLKSLKSVDEDSLDKDEKVATGSKNQYGDVWVE